MRVPNDNMKIIYQKSKRMRKKTHPRKQGRARKNIDA
jgi:hypothetical protein